MTVACCSAGFGAGFGAEALAAARYQYEGPVRYIHAHPRNAIVYLDDMTHAALLSGHNMSVTEEFDLGAIADADGAAYVGFTATSGYETAAEHEVLEWHMS